MHVITGFDGCISSISYDDISLPLYKEPHASGIHYEMISQRNIKENCSIKDVNTANSRMVIG